MPKVELHIHLEGTIRPQTALDLMRRNNPGDLPAHINDVTSFYSFTNLSEFVQGMRRVSDNIQSLEDLNKVTCELFEALVTQNVKYVEFDCALEKYTRMGFPLRQIVDVIYECAQNYRAEHDIHSNLIVNLQRSHGPENVKSLVHRVIEMDHPFIIAIGLSGDESRYPQSLFREAFALAKEAGMHRTVHAGEAAGAGSVWDAIKVLNAERIDHGTRSIEDASLVQYLAEHQIPLTQCLSSNLKLNVVQDINEHPFGEFFRKGLCVTLNTDDPQVFEVDLNHEYRLASQTFDLNYHDLSRIVLNGIDASFETDENKARLKEKIKNGLDRLGEIYSIDKSPLAAQFLNK